MGKHKVKIPITKEEYELLEKMKSRYNKLLSSMTVEERKEWFEKFLCPDSINFKRKIGNTTYLVTTHFKADTAESIEEKVIRLFEQERENEKH